MPSRKRGRPEPTQTPPSPEPTPFAAGDKVFVDCEEAGEIRRYEAKVVAVRPSDAGFWKTPPRDDCGREVHTASSWSPAAGYDCLVHYTGWNRRCDEWVRADKLEPSRTGWQLRRATLAPKLKADVHDMPFVDLRRLARISRWYGFF